MPRYKGTCGCYNRQDARELGLVPAIIWNDMLDRSEHFDINPMWYDQKDAAERLGIEYHRLNRSIQTLIDAGRITVKGGLRPNSTTRTTWVTILEDDSEISNSNSRNEQNVHFRNEQNEIPILKETKERDSQGVTARVAYFRVNPSGRAWKSQKIYTTAEEIEKLEATNPDSNIDFKYWKSPKFVGDEDKAKFKYMRAKLIIPDVVEEEEDPEEYKMINGERCKRTTYKDASGNEHEGWVRVNNIGGECY